MLHETESHPFQPRRTETYNRACAQSLPIYVRNQLPEIGQIIIDNDNWFEKVHLKKETVTRFNLC